MVDVTTECDGTELFAWLATVGSCVGARLDRAASVGLRLVPVALWIPCDGALDGTKTNVTTEGIPLAV